MIAAPPQTRSYAQGFARRRGESAYPELWDGLSALYAPCLGPTGGRVPNWSAHGPAHDGTFSGLDVGQDWVSTRFGWAVDLPGSNGHIDCGSPSALAISGRPNLSIFGLIKLQEAATYRGIWDNSQGTDPTLFRLSFSTYDNYLRLVIGDGTGYASFYSNAVLSLDKWLHVGVTVSADNSIVFYYNGAACGLATLNRDLAPSTASWKIGRALGYASRGLGGLMAALAVYDRVLPPGMAMRLCRLPVAPLCPRGRVLGMLPAIGGPYRIAAAQAFETGAAAGDLFHTGAAEGEVFNTGSIIGECDGRSG